MVFVVDTEQRALAPCHPARARRLLAEGKAAVWRRYPFTIILKRAVADAQPAPLRLKLDPGSNVTGIAVVNDTTGQVVWAGELTHRGQQVKARLVQRRTCRRSRRQRHTRYRPARFLNRRRCAGWLPPSLESRIANVSTWVERLRRWCPIGALSLELVKFDTQLMQNAEISGVEYQQGELVGYEVREYLLEKFGRKCAYCHKTNVPLQIEHIVPKVRHGSNRVSNLTIACKPCNDAKGKRTAAEFGHPEIQTQARQPLRDAAAVNATRWALYHRLAALGQPLETGTGGRTKWNRTRRGMSKTHWLDAACVGASTPATLDMRGVVRRPFGRPDGIVGRCVGRTLPGFLTKRPKRPVWLTGSGPGISCARRYRLRAPRPGCMWDGSRSGPRLVQYHDGDGDRAGHPRAVLSGPPS